MTAPNRGKGVGIAFLRAHLGDEDGACVIWPLFRDPNTGYGRMGFEGRALYSHRLMCELANGPAPTKKHQATHSCGNGHLGCVHPKHLTWKTNAENQIDRHQHGTFAEQGKHPYKLDTMKVAEILRLKDSMSQIKLAKQFGVSRPTIAAVISGKSWKDGKRMTKGFGVTPWRHGKLSKAEVERRSHQQGTQEQK